jgi:hypothetical protein
MTFSPPVFITVGDEYEKRPSLDSKPKGPGFKVGGSKKGQQSLFQKEFISLATGDKYVDPGTHERRRKLQEEKTKFKPTAAPFRYSSPSKKGGSGTYFGTFSERDPPKHEVEFVVAQPGDKPADVKPVPRNFIVNSGKRGGFGFANLTIGTGDETKYISDPYDGAKRLEAMSAKEASKRYAGPPFRTACKGSGFFDETAHGISKVYSLDKPLPAKRPTTDGSADRHTLKAWVPGGRMAVDLGKYEYQEDPYEAKEKRLREERLKQKPIAASWKPIGGPKSLPTKAIKFTPQ